MANTFVIAADSARARMFLLEKVTSLQAGSRLVEKIDLVNTEARARGKDAPRVRSERNTSRQAGPMHPQDAERDWHRAEIERRFAREIVAHASSMAQSGAADKLILAAAPRMLGLVRRQLRAAVAKRVTISEIACDYTHLTPARLHKQLAAKLRFKNKE